MRGDDITPPEFDDFQPHQVRKKHALRWRFLGMADAGIDPINAIDLRIDELGEALDQATALSQRAGTSERMRRIRKNG